MYLALVHGVGSVTLAIVYWYTLVRTSTAPSYLESPLWLGVPFAPQIVVLQGVAVACLIAWVVLMQQQTHDEDTERLLYGASMGCYAASVIWPTFATRFVERPTRARAFAASVPLWGAGACVLLLLHASTSTVTRLLLTPLVVLTVVCDAILWTLAAFGTAERGTSNDF